MTRDKLVLQSWRGGWGQALRKAVSDPFEAEFGVDVEHRHHVGLQLPSSLVMQLSAGMRPEVDLVWSNSVPALRASRSGWTLNLESDQWPHRHRLAERAFSSTAGETVVHPYVVYYVLVYQRELFADQAPQTWRVLEDPRFAKRIALYPGGNGFFPIAQVLGGGRVEDIPHDMAACWSYLPRLGGQIGELDYSIGMDAQLRSGRLQLCFRALTNALAFRRAGVDVDWCVPKEGTSDTVDAWWIPRGTPDHQQALARRYVAFSLRPDIQQRWCAFLGAMPVHRDAEVPRILSDHPRLPAHADDKSPILFVDEEMKAEHEASWSERFDQLLAALR